MICSIFSFYFSDIAFAKIEAIDIHEAEKIIQAEENKTKLPFSKTDSIKLQDGNYLITESLPLISEMFDTEIKNLIEEQLKKVYITPNSTLKIKTQSGEITHVSNNSIHKELSKIQKDELKKYLSEYLQKYITLSEEEKAKIYVPLLKDYKYKVATVNNHSYKKYLNDIERRKKVENAKIYNVKTKEFKTVGKRTIQEKHYSGYTTLLKDGSVLIGYNQPKYKSYPQHKYKKIKFEIYDPKKESFKRLKDLDNANIIHIFNNGKILLNIVEETKNNENKVIKTSIYDIFSGNYADLERVIENPFFKKIKLNDGRLLIFNKDWEKEYQLVYFNPKDNSMKISSHNIYCYCADFYNTPNDIVYFVSKGGIYKLDTKTDAFEQIGKIKNLSDGYATKFINNSIFIYNKYNYMFDGSIAYQNNIEIFNVKTRKTTIKRVMRLDPQWDILSIDKDKVLIYNYINKKSYIYTED